MKVRNMYSTRGNKVPNQFIIEGDNKVIFQSYASTIATIDYDKKTVTLGEDWDYSTTTSKYRNLFFEEYFPALSDKCGLTKAIKAGEYRGWAIIAE